MRAYLEFQEAGYHVYTAGTAEMALERIDSTPIDLLISDVRLPGMSGFDLVRRLREQGNQMPVMLMTSYLSAYSEQIEAALEIERILAKPVDPETLTSAVGELLSQRRDGKRVASRRDAAAVAHDAIRLRLARLQIEVEASGLFLVQTDGVVVGGHEFGGEELDLPVVLALVADSMRPAITLSQELEAQAPVAMQQYVGQQYELYSAAVDQQHFLLLVLAADSSRSRVATIWLFLRRAIQDLRPLLTVVASEEERPLPPLTSLAPAETDGGSSPARPSSGPMRELVSLLRRQRAGANDGEARLGNDWARAAGSGRPGNNDNGISYAEARRMGLISGPLGEEEPGQE